MARRKHYNRYDDHFKSTAVALAQIPGVQAKDVAESLAIHPVMLYRWCMESRRGELPVKHKDINIDPKKEAELKRLRKLEKEYNLLKQEHELLKKAIQHSLEQKKKSTNSSN